MLTQAPKIKEVKIERHRLKIYTSLLEINAGMVVFTTSTERTETA